MKIRTKITVMALISIILGTVGLASIIMLDNKSTELSTLQAEQDSVSVVLSAHYAWRQALTESVMTGNEFKGSLDASTCTLGQWFDSEDAKSITDEKLMQNISDIYEPHRLIHEEARLIISLLHEGNLVGAKSHLDEVIYPKTSEVIAILTSMQGRFSSLVEAKDQEGAQIARMMKIINIALIIIAVISFIYPNLVQLHLRGLE